MTGTEFFQGQGFGNQLFCYISTRCIAADLGYEFATVAQEFFGAPRWNNKGVYFMDLFLGADVKRSDFEHAYREKQLRYFNNSCRHDRKIGCDVSFYDADVLACKDGTLITGNLQAEMYFSHHKEEIKQWLQIKPEYDSYEFHDPDVCVINFRGGEYRGLRELYLGRSYWRNGMRNMKRINPAMRFMIITDDIAAASSMLPGIECRHFDLAKDYAAIKNAKYLLLSNSSFAFFPAWTSDTAEFIIAPKYWARHNVSKGHWSTSQNLYRNWHYQDRDGRLYDYEACVEEFTGFIERHPEIYGNKVDRLISCL